MREAIAHHATRAGEKLRAERLVAGRMAVFLHTNPHGDDPWHSAQHGGRIEPTDDTLALIQEAVRMLRPLWRQGFRYFKAGLMLDDLCDAEAQPRGMFPTRDPLRSAKLMAAMDGINGRFGRSTVRPLATGIVWGWSTRQSRLSPRYTTQPGEMMEARAW